MNKKILLLLFSLFIFSCAKNVSTENVVYTNDFEGSTALSNITNGATELFSGTHVLGRYNAGGFSLTVPNLPKHDLVQVSFDLYIHDTWDGNTNDGQSGPDIWQLMLDGKTYINTTFSNVACVDVFCTPQAYPDDYPNNNHNAKSGAYRTDFPGACVNAADPHGTTLYKITKTIQHSNNTLKIQGVGNMKQNGVPDPKCDESWSIDNIQVKAITL